MLTFILVFFMALFGLGFGAFFVGLFVLYGMKFSSRIVFKQDIFGFLPKWKNLFTCSC
jgi:hypothetical protein